MAKFKILHVIAAMPVGGAENVLLTTLRPCLTRNNSSPPYAVFRTKVYWAVKWKKLGIPPV
jgi:hypothetical protein